MIYCYIVPIVWSCVYFDLILIRKVTFVVDPAMDALPSEVLIYLYSFLSIKDRKAIALTAKFCYENSRKLIWNKPILKSLTVEKLSELQTLPIRYLNTSVLTNAYHGMGSKLVENIAGFLHLKELVLKFKNFRGLKVDDLSLILTLKCNIHIFSSAIGCWTTKIVGMLKERKGGTLLSLDSKNGWTLHDLRQLVGINIIHLDIGSVQLFDRNNIYDTLPPVGTKEVEFIDVMTLLKPEFLNLCNTSASLLEFTVDDLKKMRRLNVRSISSSLLFDPTVDAIQPWSALKDLQLLEKVVLMIDSFVSYEKLAVFPIKTFIVYFLAYEKNNLWSKDAPLESWLGHTQVYGSIRDVFQYFIDNEIVEICSGKYRLRYTVEFNYKYIYNPFWMSVELN